jgi:signal transduction histidine kinase
VRQVGWFFLGIVAAAAATLGLVAAVMRPPPADLLQLALAFGVTGLASGGLGFVSHRLGWWRRLPRLGLSLTLGYLAAAALTLLSVWLSARLMFLNAHDLRLAGLLLLFAGGISVSFGYFLSHSIARSVEELMQGAERLSRGDFAARVHPAGRDEVARLAQSFNAMAARLQRADAEARRQEAALRDFVAWASHDLRTPLASLLAMIDAMAEGVVEDAETVERYLRQCQAEIARMRALIDGLFELARLDSGSPPLVLESCSLSDLVSDTLQGLTERARAKGVTLGGSVDPRVDPLPAAAREIGRVLQNLVENALRHTPPGGSIELRAEVEGEAVRVSVRDTGEGISPEDLPHVFERFYRGEKSRTREGFGDGGSGLGLAIAKSLVEAHGGTIWAESEPGKGTRVTFLIPRADGQGRG